MKKSFALLIALVGITAGCSSMNRNPASQDSPEIAARQRAEIDASALMAGDKLVFNEERRFDIGSDKMMLGVARGYPTSASCALVVEPPRGERVQNYVPAGKVLTIVSATPVTRGYAPVEIRSYSRNPALMKAFVAALSERGYKMDAKAADVNAKDFRLNLPAVDTVMTYELSGSTLKSRLECKIATASYGSISLYDTKDIEKVDQANAALQRPMTVGELRQITDSRYIYLGEKTAVEFIPVPRSATQYRKIPINYEPPVRRFENIPQNSI
jgi:hypothetical protein